MSKNVKRAAEITYAPHELKAIKEIGSLITKSNNTAFAIGKLTAELVKKAGGIEYGDAVFHKIAVHPAVRCSEQHLRRCWRFYRLFAQYGKRLEKFGLCESAACELARFLGRGLGEKEAWGFISACAQRTVDTKMNVEQISTMVSAELNTIGKMRKPANRKRKASRRANCGGNGAEPGAWPHDDIEAFQAAAEVFGGLVPAQKRAHLHRNDLCRGVVTVMRPLIEITEGLTSDGPDDDLAFTLTEFGMKLLACAQKVRGEFQGNGHEPAVPLVTVTAKETDVTLTLPCPTAPTANQRDDPSNGSTATPVACMPVRTERLAA